MTQIKAPRGPDMRDSAYDVDTDFWREHSHISLQPVAAPSILGLYGFAGATFIVASNLAGWCLLVATGDLTVPTGAFVALGYWLIVLTAITWAGAAAALYESVALTAVLTLLAAGSTLTAIGYTLGQSWAQTTADWLFVCSAIIAWYVATAMMLQGVGARRCFRLASGSLRARLLRDSSSSGLAGRASGTVSNPHLGRTKGDGQFRSRPGPTATAPPLHGGAVER